MSTMINLRTCKELLRDRRDMFLRDLDWTQFNDSPLSKAKKTAWATYRQELRDLPANNPDPKWEDGDETKLPDIDWPTKPE